MPSILQGKSPSYIKSWRKNSKAIDKFQFIYHFVPHPDKNTRAGLLTHKAIIIYCLLILLVTGVFRLVPLVLPGVLGYASDINVSDLLKDTNEQRKERGFSELRLNEKLSTAAKNKAAHMFEKNYWAHISPDGVEPWDFILGENYDYIYAGENLAKNFSQSKAVVEAWLNSPSHRDNLLSPNYDEVGFAVVNGVLDGYETTLVVQMFGRPRDKVQIASVSDEQNTLKEIAGSKTEIAANISPNGGPESSLIKEVLQKTTEKPALDVGLATRTISLTFGGFVGSLLVLDIWYSKRKGMLKFTGHTFAHLTLLLLVILCIWFVLKPGVII
jgi:hypothetical protein